MIRQKKNGELIIISGTTCAGKGTIINKLLENNKNLALSISYTSRKPREGEIPGKTYNYVSKAEFEEMINFMNMIFTMIIIMELQESF